jgi:hypothetical protein
MELYGAQLAPLLQTLVERGGAAGLRSDGSFYERALYRGSLRAWAQNPDHHPWSPSPAFCALPLEVSTNSTDGRVLTK